MCHQDVKNIKFVAIRLMAIRCVLSSSECTKITFRTPLGELRRSPDPLVGWGGGHPLPINTRPHILPPRRLRRSRSRRLRQLGCWSLGPSKKNSWLHLCRRHIVYVIDHDLDVPSRTVERYRGHCRRTR